MFFNPFKRKIKRNDIINNIPDSIDYNVYKYNTGFILRIYNLKIGDLDIVFNNFSDYNITHKRTDNKYYTEFFITENINV